MRSSARASPVETAGVSITSSFSGRRPARTPTAATSCCARAGRTTARRAAPGRAPNSPAWRLTASCARARSGGRRASSGRYSAGATRARAEAVLPSITGSAYVNAEATLLLDPARPVRDGDPEMSGATADAVVIGAGIVGAACARALARDGRKVLVLEAAVAGSGATAAGMGHVSLMDDNEPEFAITRYSRDLWIQLVPELPPAAEYHPCGAIWVAEDEEELGRGAPEACLLRRAWSGDRGPRWQATRTGRAQSASGARGRTAGAGRSGGVSAGGARSGCSTRRVRRSGRMPVRSAWRAAKCISRTGGMCPPMR